VPQLPRPGESSPAALAPELPAAVPVVDSEPEVRTPPAIEVKTPPSPEVKTPRPPPVETEKQRAPKLRTRQAAMLKQLDTYVSMVRSKNTGVEHLGNEELERKIRAAPDLAALDALEPTLKAWKEKAGL
jgi:hypothetical protein